MLAARASSANLLGALGSPPFPPKLNNTESRGGRGGERKEVRKRHYIPCKSSLDPGMHLSTCQSRPGWQRLHRNPAPGEKALAGG